MTPEQETEFNSLADEWDKGIRHHSMWHSMRRHPNYKKLVAYGREAVPLVLGRIKAGDYSIKWSMLLYELSGEKCKYEPEQENGFVKIDVKTLAESWLRHFGWT